MPNRQLSINYGVTSKDAAACARAYLIYTDKSGADSLIYSKAFNGLKMSRSGFMLLLKNIIGI